MTGAGQPAERRNSATSKGKTLSETDEKQDDGGGIACSADDGTWKYGWTTWARMYQVKYEVRSGIIVSVSGDSPVSGFVGKAKVEFFRARYSSDWIAKGDYSRKISGPVAQKRPVREPSDFCPRHPNQQEPCGECHSGRR